MQQSTALDFRTTQPIPEVNMGVVKMCHCERCAKDTPHEFFPFLGEVCTVCWYPTDAHLRKSINSMQMR